MAQSNWAGNVEFKPSSVFRVQHEADVEELIQKAAREHVPIRMVGSGHSFTPLIETTGISANLDGLQGVIEIDAAHKEGWVWAGTKLKRLGQELFEHGYGMENLGDIDVQSVAGALSTGTHGTGMQFGILSTQMVGAELWNGLGQKILIDANHNPELLDAVRVSLGALGILTKLKLRLEPKYVLEMKQTKEKLFDVLAKLDQELQTERNFEFFWFPHTETALVKRSRISTQPPIPAGFSQKFNDVILENVALGALSGLCRWVPPTTQVVSRFCADASSASHRRDWSHRVFATERWVKFLEMEYSIPMDRFIPVVNEIQTEIQKENHRVHFPIECRFVRGDSSWLSPAHDRDSALIAVHMYRGMPYKHYFKAMERIFQANGGRPHWGKWHSMRADALAAHYPRWNDFQNLRMEMDPHSVFDSHYLNRILGERSRIPALSLMSPDAKTA